jgi:hypothetical protein
VDFLHRGVDIAVGQAGEANLAVGIVAAEIAEPVVVDAQHLVGRLVVLDARGDAQDAEDDLGVDAVLLHLLDPQMRVAGAALAALAGVVEPRFGHLVDPVVLPRDERRADRTDCARNAHDDSGLGHPAWAVSALLDIGHAVLQFPRRPGGEEVRRQPWQVEMAIGRNPAVLHGETSLRNSVKATLRRIFRHNTRQRRMTEDRAMRARGPRDVTRPL